MLSVLIPVYREDPSALIRELAEQMRETAVAGEIIVLDDGSPEKVTPTPPSELGGVQVHWHRADFNKGRFATRKELAEMATCPWLLFLDADVRVINKNYLNVVLQQTGKSDAASGGTLYPEAPPDCIYTLHWKYGRKRQSAARYNKGLEFNNFLIRKDLFLSMTPEQLWPGYGHEDTYYGIRLAAAGARYQKISNPVLHTGLDPAPVFLHKSGQALQSILRLSAEIGQERTRAAVRVYRTYLRLSATGLMAPLSLLLKMFHGPIVRNLHSCRPSLWLYDLLRLRELHLLQRQPGAVKRNKV